MSLYYDDLITFPVFMLGNHPMHMSFTEDHIQHIHPCWRQLTSSIPVPKVEFTDMPESDYWHTGILTGKNGGITVIECNYNKVSHIDTNTLCVKTLMLNYYYFFEYEPSLNSIYNPQAQASVLNDGCCAFAGLNYSVINDSPIIKMPESVLAFLTNEQNNHYDKYDQEIYELMMLLPDEWFSEPANNNMLIDGIKNLPSTNPIRINTLRKILSERWDYFNERLMVDRIKDRSNYKQLQVTIAAIKKIVYRFNRQGLESWARKWHPRAANQLRYHAGSIIRLSEVQAIYNSESLAKRLAKNAKLQIVKRNTCKSCKQLHLAGCCSKYSGANRSSAKFILNGYISK